jgi:hypothetical protein
MEGLGAEEKWEKLCEWNRKTLVRSVPKGEFWRITPEGVIHRKYDDRAASGRHARRASAAIPAKVSGQSHLPLSR